MKTRAELITRIETVEAERDKTRNFLRQEHDKSICKGQTALLAGYRQLHEEIFPDCPVCQFLIKTSTV